MTPRGAAAVRNGTLAIAPPGWAVPRDPGSRLSRLLGVPAAEIAAVERSAAALLEEIDPRSATYLLDDFERALGPDPCDSAGPTTMAERRRVAHSRWTLLGGASIPFFVAFAAARGVAITVEERRPFKAGRSKAGHPCATREARFSWRVRLPASRAVTFRAGAGRAGQSLGAILPAGVECAIARLAPAHTAVVFAYGA